ncbi:MAG: acyltransferase, partial [Solirubrobacterales bacterium]|nr:acyltransferase [Solirubrobacterales bacterium]
MAEPLSAADRSALSAEQGPVSMAVGGVMLLEDGPGLAPAAFLERVSARLHLLPRYRQRLQTAAGVLNPVWVDDTTFDVGWHVRRAALGAGAGEAELAELVGREMGRRLDRSRPLWELTVVEGLADGRVALLAKMHHALVDGVAAIDIGTVLLDPGPEPLELPPPDADWAPRPYDRLGHLARLGLEPAR